VSSDGYWTSRPDCTILHTGGENNERVGGWRQNPNAPAEHEHYEIPRGGWIGRPSCPIVHLPSERNQEDVGGWRYRGEGYDHEHFELFPVEIPLPREEIIMALEEPQRVTCSITLSDGTEVHVQGSAAVVSHILHSVADVLLEEHER
jgi:hypothetical protein